MHALSGKSPSVFLSRALAVLALVVLPAAAFGEEPFVIAGRNVVIDGRIVVTFSGVPERIDIAERAGDAEMNCFMYTNADNNICELFLYLKLSEKTTDLDEQYLLLENMINGFGDSTKAEILDQERSTNNGLAVVGFSSRYRIKNLLVPLYCKYYYADGYILSLQVFSGVGAECREYAGFLDNVMLLGDAPAGETEE
jgi:hypothetical protein